ncbi:MAG TPA: restriction endonuclease subunit S [Actinomycetota bacterium]|nr:restriction endonuclease subunit S [Actinomycetota bacterium]
MKELADNGVLLFNDGYRTKQAELGTDGFPILRVSQIWDGRIREDGDLEYVRHEFRSKIGAKLAAVGDVVLTTKGTVGRRARVTSGDRRYVYSPQVCFFRVLDAETLDPNFFYYWLGSPWCQAQIDAFRSQTDMADYVNLRDLAQVRIDLPPIARQRRVGRLLRAIDDKIELNRRTGRTLEEMAKAIFKSWFVDFDPVRAKATGRRPIVPPELADLFPSKLVGSPIGPVPEGWEVAPLGEHVEVVRGLSYRGADLVEEGEGLPLHNLNSILERGGYNYEGIKWYAGEYKQRHLVEPGDVIVANTDLTHRLRVIGYPAIVPRAFGQDGLFSADLFRIRPAEGSPLSSLYLHHALLTPRLRAQVVGYTSGTTVNHLSIEGLRRPPFVVPPAPLVAGFDALVRPMVELAEQLVEESRTLAQLRDWLIPKLISGQVRVPFSQGSSP